MPCVCDLKSCVAVMEVEGKISPMAVNASGGESGETEGDRGRHIAHYRVL